MTPKLIKKLLKLMPLTVACIVFVYFGCLTHDHRMDIYPVSQNEHNIIISRKSNNKKNDTNPGGISSHNLFLKHLTICIGVQKSGTGTIRNILRDNTSDIVANGELHYFDSILQSCRRSKKWISLNHTLKCLSKRYKGLSSTYQYIDKLKKSYTNAYKKVQNMTNDQISIFEKTPEYIFHPHAVYLIAKDFIKYGTKIVVLMRNPVNRFISGYFLTTKPKDNAAHSIDKYLHNVVYNKKLNQYSFVQFRTDLNELFMQYSKTNDNITRQLTLLKQVYNFYETLYYDNLNLKVGKLRHNWIWTRSCYGPQIIMWLYYIDKLNKSSKYKHSFKIIQSEQMYQIHSFHQTMIYVLCYIHYDIMDDKFDYNKWMGECIDNDIYNAKDMVSVKTNSVKPKSFQPTIDEIEKISNSYSICNEWLYSILDSKSDYIILDKFDKDLWE